ncbi:MAG: endonuclease MutS2 [Oscillospiraceae bacterium]|nr:endonuclease MutS2 [Oscillospiraceae bacterium]
MTTKYLKALELDKIIRRGAEFAVCPEAREMLTQQPPYDTADEVRDALLQTDTITSLLLKNGGPRFYRVEAVDKIVRRAGKGGILSMSELLQAANALRNFRGLVQWYHSTEHEMLAVDDYFYALSPQPELEKRILDSILSETEMADTASDTLYETRRKIHATEAGIRDKLDRIVKTPGTIKYLQDAVISLRNGRFVVPVKAENRNDIQGVIHDVSQSGSTLFVEPTAVVEANAKILQLRNQEKAEIERILQAFSAQIASYEEVLLFSYDAMLKIDVLLAKAHLALEQKAAMPAVSDKQAFHLVKARHPLIDKDKVVAVDISLGENADTMVITGPNTGGKTVTLKTAGLLCAMAQHGFLIPAHDSSTVCVFAEILVDIGDEQSIEQSLSTFSGHIKNITGILALANANTLVLMDELGAGTDPAEGAALAVAIIEKLRGLHSLVMATTHYGELKIFALETSGVVNASCEFNVETLRPTYRLSVGVPGKSNAFLIGQKLGLPQEIIANAQKHLSAGDKQFDTVLTQLEELKLQLKEGQNEIERLKSGAQYELAAAEKKRAELVAQGEAELALARDKAKGVANDVQSEAYRLLDELKKLEKDSAQSAAQRAARAREIARKDSEKLFNRSDVVHVAKKQFEPLKSVVVGQEVLIADLDKTGFVVTPPDRKGFVQVRAGVITTKVLLAGLAAPNKQKAVPASKQPQRRNVTPSTGGDKAVRTANMEINLLGMSVEEALMEADRFIDNGVLSGLGTLYLIHGKGTGALRSAIHAHLRGHKNVRTFRLGAYGEGEAGVTVVELK